MSVEEMVERCIRKDQVAWDEFVRRYQSLIRKVAYYKLYKTSSTAPRNDVDDIVQEVFLMLWKDDKLSKIRDISRLSGWLAVVTINMVATYRRQQYKRDSVTMSLDEQLLEDIVSCNQPDPARVAETKEAISWLEYEINKLRDKEKEAFMLKVYAGDTQNRISGIMGIPANTVASLVRRAKIKVRNSVTEECYL